MASRNARFALGAFASFAALGCSSELEKRCETFATRVEECVERLPPEGRSQVESFCAASKDFPESDFVSLPGMSGPAIDECSRLTDCDEIIACFKRNQCTWIFNGPDDKTGMFGCQGSIPSASAR